MNLASTLVLALDDFLVHCGKSLGLEICNPPAAPQFQCLGISTLKRGLLVDLGFQLGWNDPHEHLADIVRRAMELLPIPIIEVSPSIKVVRKFRQLGTIRVFPEDIDSGDINMDITTNVVLMESPPHDKAIVLLSFPST